jgi:colicin import membrane protein
MNAHAQPIAAAEPATDLVVLGKETVLALITDQKAQDELYDKVAAQVSGHAADITTDKGRKAIAALAFKVTKSKTGFVGAANELTEQWRKDTASVVAVRKSMEERFTALAAEVRKPLTEWEEAEDARMTRVKVTMDRLRVIGVIGPDDTPTTLGGRLMEVEAIDVTDEEFGDYAPAARAHAATAVEALTNGIARLEQAARDAAELAALRAQTAAREEAERLAREETARAEAAAVAAQIAAEAEAQRVADQAEAAERARIAQEEAVAAAAAHAAAAAEKAAQQAAAAHEAAHQAELARLKKIADDAEAARAKEVADRKAADEAAAAAQAKRDGDLKHRALVMGAAKAAMMAAGGIGEEAAKKIALAIRAGEIPAVTLTF